MKKIKLKRPSDNILKLCKKFAEASASTSKSEYARRGQVNLDKIKMDIYRGKIAEFMVYNLMVSKNIPVTKPDVKIYKGSDKSFDSDLIIEGNNIHIKSHFVNHTFPISWVFQKNDKITQRGANRDKDYLCLVVMHENFDGWFYMSHVNQFDFKPPVKKTLRLTKVCIYESDLDIVE